MAKRERPSEMTLMAQEAIEPVEPAQPIHANLIQFPRELVATRRMRPRLTGDRMDALGELFGQLSIFEVDPSTISTEPAQASGRSGIARPGSGAAPSGRAFELDEQPEEQSRKSKLLRLRCSIWRPSDIA